MGGIVNNSDVVTGSKEDVHDLSFYRFVIDSLPTGILTVNADLKIPGCNPWAEKVTGYTEPEVLGRFWRYPPWGHV